MGRSLKQSGPGPALTAADLTRGLAYAPAARGTLTLSSSSCRRQLLTRWCSQRFARIRKTFSPNVTVIRSGPGELRTCCEGVPEWATNPNAPPPTGEVVVVNMGVAEAVAFQYRGRGISEEDLKQVACLALIHAARHYDHTVAGDFLCYCVPTIRGQIRHHFRDQGWMARPPRRLQELQARVFLAQDELIWRLAECHITTRTPTLGATPHEVSEAFVCGGCFTPCPPNGNTVQLVSHGCSLWHASCGMEEAGVGASVGGSGVGGGVDAGVPAGSGGSGGRGGGAHGAASSLVAGAGDGVLLDRDGVVLGRVV